MVTLRACLLCLFCGSLTSASLAAQRPTQIRVLLEHPERADLEGRSLGLIPCWPHKALAKLTLLKVQAGNRIGWDVPAEACDRTRMTWFLVQDLKEESQVEKFLAHPEKWSWTRFSVILHPKGNSGGQAMLMTKGARMLGAGHIVGPDGKPPRHLFLSVLPKKGQDFGASYRARTSRVGYDPKSGRFWAQCPKEIGDIVCLLGIQASADKSQGLADRFGIPLVADQPMRIRLARECVLSGQILGPRSNQGVSIQASLAPTAGQGRERKQSCWDRFQFRGLPAGSYDLKIRWGSDGPVLFEKKGLILEEGKTLAIPETFDVMSKLQVIQITVTDAEDHPVQASVSQIFLTNGGYRSSGSGTDSRGKTERFLQRDGPPGYFLIHAKGLAPRIIHGVRSDFHVQLHRPQELRVQLVGLPQDLVSGKKLSLRAEPPGGYPRFAWSFLRIEDPSSWVDTPRGRRHPFVQYCSTKILEEKPLLLKLTAPGKWRLSLTTRGFNPRKRFVLPGFVEMTRPKQNTAVRVPPETVELIREYLKEQEKNRGR